MFEKVVKKKKKKTTSGQGPTWPLQIVSPTETLLGRFPQKDVPSR